MNYLTTHQEHPMLFWRLRNVTKISDAKFVRYHLEPYLGGGSYENTRENEVGGIGSEAKIYHERKMSETANNLFFLRKINGPRTPKIFYATSDCFHLDQD